MGAINIAYWQMVFDREIQRFEPILAGKKAYIDRIKCRPPDEVRQEERASLARNETELKAMIAIITLYERLCDAYLHQSAEDADVLVKLATENQHIRHEIAKHKLVIQDLKEILESQFNDQTFLVEQCLKMLKTDAK
jgi:hypothetical protein